LGRAFRRHPQFRAISVEERRRGTKIFSTRFKEGTETTILERIDDPLKNWKFSSNDAAERDFWDDYMQAYEEMIQETATKEAPWYVGRQITNGLPRDRRWGCVETLADLDLEYPEVGEDNSRSLP